VSVCGVCGCDCVVCVCLCVLCLCMCVCLIVCDTATDAVSPIWTVAT
jgi:hypothetical protein